MLNNKEGEILVNIVQLTNSYCRKDEELALAVHCLEMAQLEILLVLARRFESGEGVTLPDKGKGGLEIVGALDT